MISGRLGFDLARSVGLLVDTNLLVLFTVGSVNRNRIETFKRTRQYSKGDYDLLVSVLGNSSPYIRSLTFWPKSVTSPICGTRKNWRRGAF